MQEFPDPLGGHWSLANTGSPGPNTLHRQNLGKSSCPTPSLDQKAGLATVESNLLLERFVLCFCFGTPWGYLLGIPDLILHWMIRKEIW